jgi:hypothetical protein
VGSLASTRGADFGGEKPLAILGTVMLRQPDLIKSQLFRRGNLLQQPCVKLFPTVVD